MAGEPAGTSGLPLRTLQVKQARGRGVMTPRDLHPFRRGAAQNEAVEDLRLARRKERTGEGGSPVPSGRKQPPPDIET